MRIDVHHHVIPPVYSDYLRSLGIEHVAGAPLPKWTPERSLAVMDVNSIETAILSVSSPGVHFGDEAAAVRLARACNEYCAGLRNDHRNRFGYFAVLPMPLVSESCKEACRALDELGADGVVLLGSSRGKFLGDAAFDELMHELNTRKATVFVHPNIHQTSTTLDLDTPGFLVEFLCDTTRAAVNLVLNGTLERYPNIKFILAHAGGFLPYIAWRISLANLMPECNERAPNGVLHYIRKFYFDTALSPSPFALSALEQLVEPNHILFGSDFPFAPEPVTTMQIESLSTARQWESDQLKDIERNNALALFPRLGGGGSAGELTRPVNQSGLRVAVKRKLIRGVVSLADRVRNR